MNIGIFGGTFDPPHLGHMGAAAAALELLALDRLIFVPDSLPPHKALPAEGAGAQAAQRYDMVCLMADGMQADGRVLVSRAELDRAGKSYTADTLAALRDGYPNDDFWLLVGSDMFLSLQHWRTPERIFAQAGVVAFSRTGDDAAALDAQVAHLRDAYGARVRVLALPQVYDLSSTRLRTLLAAGDSAAAAHLWPPVYGYILRHGLYGCAKPLTDLTRDELRAVSLSMIRYQRAAHICGTEDEAVKLARRWGVSVDDAARAAILHDCTKYLSREEHLALCAEHAIPVDALERSTDKLLHAKTAAALARDLFGENEAVVAAIASHTTGAPHMTPLQKIIYIADYIEPTRDFPELPALRTMAYEDLDRTVGICLSLSAREIAEKGRTLHHNTAQALAYARSLGYV